MLFAGYRSLTFNQWMIRSALLILLLSVPAHAGSVLLQGTPKVILGDVLEVQGTRVRLIGIDAPERGQNCRAASGREFDCGHIAVTALMDLTAGVAVRCELTDQIVDDLPVALCKAGGYDLSEGMVHAGSALASPGNQTIYSKIEKTARKGKHGMWRGEFDQPWDWLRGIRKKLNSPTAATQ